MSNPDSSSASPTLTVVRSPWFPAGLLSVFGVFVAGLWWWTNTDGQPVVWRWVVPAAGVTVLLLLAVWLLLARLPPLLRWPTLALVVLPPVAVAALFEIHFDKGLWPILRPRYWSLPDDILEQHLAGAVNEGVPDRVDLSGRLDTDWPEYRGPRRDGIVLGPELLRDWNTQPPRQLWQHPIGGGHAGFAVADKALFTMEQRRGNEAITSYDADTGKQYWTFTYPAFFDESLGGKGPRATPTVVDGEVYALGGTGMLTCLEARTGKVKWGPVDLLQGNANLRWGMCGSPLVLDDVVVVGTGVQKAGAPLGAVVAVERKTGKVAWSNGNKPAGYSSPMLATLCGKRQIVLLDGHSVAGYDPAAQGNLLWRFKWMTSNDVNAAQPLILDRDRLFIASGYKKGCAMLEVKESQGTWNVQQLWSNQDALRCQFGSPVHYRGHIYGLDDVTLSCVNAETGAVVWEGGNYGHGQVLLSKDVLIVQGEHGEVALVEATPAKAQELGRLRPWTDRTWNLPALAAGRLYLRNDREMTAYDLKAP